MGAAHKTCWGTGAACSVLADKISGCASDNLFPCSTKDKKGITTDPPPLMIIFLGDTIISAAAGRNFSEGRCIQNNQFSSTDHNSNVPNATRAYATGFVRLSPQY